MPYRLTWSPQAVEVRYCGALRGDELLGVVESIHADERFDDLRYSLNDFRDCSAIDCPAPLMETCAALDCAAARSNPNIMLIVIGEAAAVGQVVRAYDNAGISRYPVRQFPDSVTAWRWIAERNASHPLPSPRLTT